MLFFSVLMHPVCVLCRICWRQQHISIPTIAVWGYFVPNTLITTKIEGVSFLLKPSTFLTPQVIMLPFYLNLQVLSDESTYKLRCQQYWSDLPIMVSLETASFLYLKVEEEQMCLNTFRRNCQQQQWTIDTSLSLNIKDKISYFFS